MLAQSQVQIESYTPPPDLIETVEMLFAQSQTLESKGTARKIAKLEFILANVDTFTDRLVEDSMNSIAPFYNYEVYDMDKYQYTKSELIQAHELIVALKAKIYDIVDYKRQMIINETIINLEKKISEKLNSESIQSMRETRAALN